MKTRNELKKEQRARAKRWEASKAAAVADQILQVANGYQAIERRLGFGYIGTFPTEGQARAALATCTQL